MPKKWSPQCEDYLRREYSRQSVERIASRLGCTPVAIRSRAKKLGVQTGSRRRWTQSEQDILIAFYRSRGALWCAKRLSRTLSQVYQAADRLGMMQRRRCATDQQITDAVKRYHPAGYCDPEIARIVADELGVAANRHRVGAIRRRLHLPCNRDSERCRAAVAAKTQEQLQRSGHKSLAELKTTIVNNWKRNRGWPEHLSLRAVQAAELFYRHGQLTRVQLCELMGVPNNSRTAPKSNSPHGTVLAELEAAGLITRLPKAIPVPGDLRLHTEPVGRSNRVNKTKYIDLYFLNAGVEPNHGKRTEAS